MTFDDVPIVDDVVVARLLALRDQVAKPGEDVLGDLLVLFTRDTRARIAALRASAQSELDRRQAAHALKGSAGNVGAGRVAAIAAHVEKHGVDADALDRLEREVEVALLALAARLGLPPARPR